MKENSPVYLSLSLSVLLLLAVVACFLGRYPSSPLTPIDSIMNDPLALQVLLKIRIPRILFALILGAALGGGGYVFQTVFHNPLVEPGFLGVSQGAAFGAALAITTTHSNLVITQISALFFGLMGLMCSNILSRRFNIGDSILKLILSGIAVSAFFSSGLGLIKYLADPLKELQEIVLWMMGSLSAISWKEVVYAGFSFCLMMVTLLTLRWKILLLSADEMVAQSLDPKIKQIRELVLVAAVVMVSSVIAVTGIVGWVGLVIPHIAIKVTKSNNSHALGYSIIFGAGFVLISDTFARTVFPGEIPLGIITALFGALIFLFIFTNRKRINLSE